MTNKERRRLARFALRIKDSPFYTTEQYFKSRMFLIAFKKEISTIKFEPQFPYYEIEPIKFTEKDAKNRIFRVSLKAYFPMYRFSFTIDPKDF